MTHKQRAEQLHRATADGRARATPVHCTGLNTLTPPHDQVTCALHTHRGATHSPLYRPFTEASLASDRSSPWAPASGWQSPRYTSALHRSQHPDSTPRSGHLCAAHPPRCYPSTFVPPPGHGKRMADPALHECVAQVSTVQLFPTIRSPVRCTPAAALPIHLCTARSRKPAWQVTVCPPGHRQADGSSLRYTSALHRSQQSNSTPRSGHLCAAHPPRCYPFTSVPPPHEMCNQVM